MSLRTEAAHARRMSTAEHAKDCPWNKPAQCKSMPVWQVEYDENGVPYAMNWLGVEPGPEPCEGCVSNEDRALWKKLADELEKRIREHDEREK